MLLALSAPAQAAKLDIPTPLKYEGLTFLPPLPVGIVLQSHPPTFTKYSTIIDFHPLTEKLAPDPSLTQGPPESISNVQITEVLASPTPSQTPTSSPNPTATSTPTAQPTQTGSNTSTGGGLNADALFSMSNDYRTSHGLAPFQKDERVCSLAAVRAPEIGAEIAEGHMHSGKNSHNFLFWFTENIISMNSVQAAFNWWINDPIHHDAIVGAYSHSCVACSGNSCVQEFTNFQAK